VGAWGCESKVPHQGSLYYPGIHLVYPWTSLLDSELCKKVSWSQPFFWGGGRMKIGDESWDQES
jgi:hypothetical protein